MMYQEDAEYYDHQRQLVQNEAERRRDTGFVTDTSQYPWIEEDAVENDAQTPPRDPDEGAQVDEWPDEDEETDSEAAAETLLYTILQDAPWIDKVLTFEEGGVLSYNKGLVIVTRSGEEYQLTIVRSR